jgi:amino acid adenylation domain-containing protein
MVNKDEIRDFIVEAYKGDVLLYLDEGALKTRAPSGAVTAAIGAFIKANKQGIIDCLAGGFSPCRGRLPLVPGGEANSGLVSLVQDRFWFINQLNDAGTLYNMPFALRITGQFDPDIAELAMQRIVDRHAPLHCVYANDADGSVRQRRRENTQFKMLRFDLSGLTCEAQDARIRELMRDSAGKIFDLERDLMITGTHIALSPLEGILLLCAHHIAADGWSFLVIRTEFVEQYRAISNGEPDPLGALHITYADYARWQRERLQGGFADVELSYWQRQLAGLPVVHELPLDHPRSERQTHQGRQYDFRLSAALSIKLKQLARANNITLFMLLHGAFALMLSRYSNVEDIVIGTPVLNRLERELELLVGCFVNTLVLRVSCAADFTLPDFLQHVKAVNLDAQSHQEVTFDQIVDQLNPTRTTLYAPLFQIMFSMGMPQMAVRKNKLDMKLELLRHEVTTAKHDLCLYGEEIADELFFGFEYKTELFDSATIEGMADGFQALLANIVVDPDAQLSQLSLLDDAKAQQLAGWSRGSAQVVESACVHELFERQVSIRPDAIAIVCADGQLSYAELNVRANRLAHHLRVHGVGPDVLVALCLERSLHLAVAILAVWKAGGAYVPLDPEYPQGRIHDILHDTRGAYLLSQTHLAERFADGTASLWLVDDEAFEQSLQQQCTDNIDRASLGLTTEHLAYVIFTSGSTGRPKGVMIEHRSAVNLGEGLRDKLEAIDVKGACRWAWNASPSFDASVQALLQWANGSTLHLLTDSVRLDPDEMLNYLREQRIDVLDTTPLQAEMLLNAAGLGERLPLMVIGGEAISPQLWDRIAAHYASEGRRAINVYGPTEATVDATAAWIVPGRPTIGSPLTNVRCHVLDRHGKPQPVGASGELHIGGIGVARGYVGRPELTAERFIDIELDGVLQRLYRTGDLVRWLPGGALEFIGRADGQVKIRGYRVELGEIEHRLRQLSGIGAVAVRARGEDEGPLELVAYVVPDTGSPVADDWAEPLRQSLRTSLPAYMIPTHFVAMEALPLTASGKLNVAALPAPGHKRKSICVATSPAEVLVAGVWAEQLKLDVVGVDENFFQIGGHSILAARVISRLATIFQIRIPLRLMFEHPSVRELVACLGELADSFDAQVLDEIAETYLTISSLDDEQVEAMLAARKIP